MDELTRLQSIFDRAVTEQNHGHFAKAKELYLQLLALRPDTAAAHHNLGLVLQELGDVEGACRSFRNAIARDPAISQAYFCLGNVYCQIRRPGDAIAMYRKALAIEPANRDFLQNLGAALALLESVREARELLGEMEALLQESGGWGFYYFGKAFDAMNDRATAAMCFAEVMRRSPHVLRLGPARVRLEVSSACNLRCRHCLTGTQYGSLPRGRMSLEVFERLRGQLAAMPSVREAVMYLGGEPLVNPEFAWMCRKIKEGTHVGHTQFNTNAMLVDEDFCRRIAQARVDLISVSVDGESPEENDAIRRGSRYAQVVEKASLLRRFAPPGTKFMVACTLVRTPDSPEEPVCPEHIRRDFPGWEYDVHYAMKWPGYDPSLSGLPGLTTRSAARPERCFCAKPFVETAVRANGDVVPCCNDIKSGLVLGNVGQQTLGEIWNGDSYHALRRAMIGGRFDRLPAVCRDCLSMTGEYLFMRHGGWKAAKAD